MTERAIYIHFMDAYHANRARQNSHSRASIVEEARRAFRMALSVSTRVYVPASSFFESEVARVVLSEHETAAAVGHVRLTAGDPTLEEHRAGKLVQYDVGSPLGLGEAYLSRLDSEVAYQARPGRMRAHLERRWWERLRTDDLLKDIDPFGHLELDGSLAVAWEQVPTEMGALAFVPGHAERVLAHMWRGDTARIRSYMSKLIESSYVELYMDALGAGVVRDLVRLESPFPLPTHPDSFSYSLALQALARRGELRMLDAATEGELLAGRDRLRLLIEESQGSRRTRVGQVARVRYRPTVGIVTILEEEFQAVVGLLHDTQPRSVRNDPHAYMLGRVRTATLDGPDSWDVVVVKQLRMTNPSSATTTTLLLRSFSTVRDVVLVGIGGGVPRPGSVDKDIALGDVVVSDRSGIFHYDHVTARDGTKSPRASSVSPSPRLLGGLDRMTMARDPTAEIAKGVERLRTRDSRFTRPSRDTDVLRNASRRVIRRGGNATAPRLFRGILASGNMLVRDPEVRDRLAEESGALVIDMESAGVAEAAWTHSRQYLVVRGISDYCDATKNDLWHWYAAGTAAVAAVSILEFVTN